MSLRHFVYHEHYRFLLEQQKILTPFAVDGLSRLRRAIITLLFDKKQLTLLEIAAHCYQLFKPHTTFKDITREALKMTNLYPIKVPLLELVGRYPTLS